MQVSDFFDPSKQATIECEFGDLSNDEKKNLRPYLIEGKVILRKELVVAEDHKKGKKTVKAEYHGYQAEPKDFHFSVSKIVEMGRKQSARRRTTWYASH